MPKSRRNKNAIQVTPKLLRSWPLPQATAEGDKETRGSVLVIAGTEGMPGAAILPAIAALRAGAGKLQIATPKCIAPWVALAVLEAYVLSLSEKKSGILERKAIGEIKDSVAKAKSVLVGPGMAGGSELSKFVSGIAPHIQGTLVIDAEALQCFSDKPDCLDKLRGQVIITPHAGEMAKILRLEKDEIRNNQLSTARDFAMKNGVITVLKGSQTVIANVDGEVYSNSAGNVGLATSGSGDTLSGIISGLAARGAKPLQAAVWGVYLHAAAGDVLMKRVGPLGFLARELLAEIPMLMYKLLPKVR